MGPRHPEQRGKLMPGIHLPAPKRTCTKKHFKKKKKKCCSLLACRQDQGSASCFVLHLLPPFIALITAVTLQSWAVFLPNLWKMGFCMVPLCLLQCLPLTWAKCGALLNLAIQRDLQWREESSHYRNCGWKWSYFSNRPKIYIKMLQKRPNNCSVKGLGRIYRLSCLPPDLLPAWVWLLEWKTCSQSSV